ncbi:MAG TPA: hypothetical protein VII06_33380 [Chloroflexota bacterium]|jgi:hypothetical protein
MDDELVITEDSQSIRAAEHGADLMDESSKKSGRGRPEVAVPRGREPSPERAASPPQGAARARYAAGGVSLRQLARELGVTSPTVLHALRGQTWAHVA